MIKNKIQEQLSDLYKKRHFEELFSNEELNSLAYALRNSPSKEDTIKSLANWFSKNGMRDIHTFLRKAL